MPTIAILEGYSALPTSRGHSGSSNRRSDMARRKRRSRGGASQRRKFAAAARACRGKSKGAFRACMKKKLKKKR